MKQEVKHEHSVNYEPQKERLLFVYKQSYADNNLKGRFDAKQTLDHIRRVL